MEPEAAPTAEAQPRPAQAEAPSPQSRIKSYLIAQSEPEPAPRKPAQSPREEHEQEAATQADQAEPEETEAEEAPAEQEATEETEAKYESVNELAEALGWDIDKILDMDASTKIDGKESKAKIRDLIKSYQLESHLTNKLQAHSNEVKAFQEQATRQVQELAQRTQYLQHAQSLAEQLLHAEFATTNWDQLRAEDPAAYNSKTVEFQDRQRKIQQLASQLGAERQRTAQQAEADQQSYLAEQSRLLEAKVPEWADGARQQKEIAEMIPVLTERYGITEQRLRSEMDHGMLLAARDLWLYRKLVDSKPAILNKVKNAPRLLKPGTPQSQASKQGLQLKSDMARLKSTGKVRDSISVFKRLLSQ